MKKLFSPDHLNFYNNSITIIILNNSQSKLAKAASNALPLPSDGGIGTPV